jgi:hypothetical protein
MPTSAGSQLITLRYISQTNPQNNLDTCLVQFYTRFTSAAFNLATTMAGVRAGHHMVITPTATAAPSATEELVLEVTLLSRYLVSDLGSPYLLTIEGSDHNNGHSFSYYSSPSTSGAVARVLAGQYANKFAGVKLMISGLPALTATSYTFRMPLLQTAVSTGAPYLATLRLLKYSASSVQPAVLFEWSSLNLIQTTSATVSSFTPSLSFGSCAIQSTCSGTLTLGT